LTIGGKQNQDGDDSEHAGLKLYPLNPVPWVRPFVVMTLKYLMKKGMKCKQIKSTRMVVKLTTSGTLLIYGKTIPALETGYLEQFPGYYFQVTEDIKMRMIIFITGRVDDVINVAGHRLSTAEEEVVASHQSVAECAVGINDALGTNPALVVLGRKPNRTFSIRT
jgi:propionyl-CoA synthetase